MGTRILRIMPTRMQKHQATRINVPLMARRSNPKSTKVRISSHQWNWRSTVKKTVVFDVESKGIATAIAQRRRKEHHKHRTFYPLIMMSQCKVHPNYCIHGGECGIKAHLCSWILALLIISYQLNLHRGWGSMLKTWGHLYKP